MKHFMIIITVALLLCFLGGCTSDSEKKKAPSSSGKDMAEESLDKSQNTQTDSKTEDLDETPAEGAKPGEHEETDIPDRDENKQQNTTGTMMPNQDPLNHQDSNKQEPSEPQSSKQEQTGEKETPSSTPSVSSRKEEPAPEVTPPVKNAGKEDERAVAQKVLEYINGYREVPAVSLSGLAGYAQYRSKQLVSNFSHDTNDQRIAATELKYGEYMDPTLFGGSGEPYYRANAREAIVKAGYVGSVDYVAQELAKLVYQSKSHWSYIGASEYGYIAVGITYKSDMWYCAITVTAQNTDEL